MEKKLLHYSIIVFVLLITLSQGLLWADTGPQHQARQNRPIQLGTSGGNIGDMSSAFCCSGTLGALVEDGSVQYVLSNNHVLARTNVGVPGEDITQPGLVDNSCRQNSNDTVAYFTDAITIRFKQRGSVPLNEVDAAIAQVVPGDVNSNGAILDIGVLNANILEASIGQAVKKSGRTTGLTRGTIQAVDVTVDVGYSKECGGGSLQTARFVNQIVIGPSGFSAGGDSGSLIVEDVASKPRAVGLLFAGSSTTTIANPMNSVLSAFGVTMPGGLPPEPKPTGSISGTVVNSANKSPIQGAAVTVDTGESAITGSDGIYLITNVAIGSHSITASAAGFKSQTKTATVSEGQEINVNFSLKPSKGRGSSMHQAIEHAIQVKRRHEQKIFEINGVVGTGVGVSEADQPVIEIYLKDIPSEQARLQIPGALDNIPVRVKVTGQFEAF